MGVGVFRPGMGALHADENRMCIYTRTPWVMYVCELQRVSGSYEYFCIARCGSGGGCCFVCLGETDVGCTSQGRMYDVLRMDVPPTYNTYIRSISLCGTLFCDRVCCGAGGLGLGVLSDAVFASRRLSTALLDRFCRGSYVHSHDISVTSIVASFCACFGGTAHVGVK